MSELILGVKPQYYYVEVGARLDQRWLEYLPVVDNRDCNLAIGAAGTAMVLYVVDQAELMGIINSLHGLGLALMLVKRLADYRPESLS
mgnify:CR=1 FL=1